VTHNSGSGIPMSERMQSLLSRAVDDQHSEQRSLAAALDEVRTQLATLARDVAASRSEPAEHDAAAVGALTIELRESTRRTGDRLDALSRMVAQRGEDIATLQNSLVALDGQLRAQAEGVAGLASSVDGIGQHLNGIATYLGERARDDGSRIAALEQRLVTLQNDMTAVGGHVAGLTDSTGDALDSRIRSIVAGALVGTERRLATHIDDAVLALAEAMLRRRPAGREAAAPDAAPVEPPAPVEPAAAVEPAAPVEPPAAEAPPMQAQPAVAVEAPLAQPLVDPFPTAAQPEAEQADIVALPDGPPVQPPVEELPSAPEATPEHTVDVTDPALAATAASNGGSAGASGNGAPKVPAAWTTVMPDDDQRRRGWFRSRE
jgi:hypothetical protein